MAVLPSLRLQVRLPHRALAVARLGLCRVLAARAKDLRAVLMAVVSCRDEVVPLGYSLQPAQETRVLHFRQA
jgi:hypothetical protein